ncbi:hypothetical protein [Deinococcus kurensis]|uniref:hypothetical protein n=1 Tax=Deinococcus kurensis TaxID=2662757 RepID=UPI0012D34832|nr:hypothetical protein [Deinococcus kurensis]
MSEVSSLDLALRLHDLRDVADPQALDLGTLAGRVPPAHEKGPLLDVLRNWRALRSRVRAFGSAADLLRLDAELHGSLKAAPLADLYPGWAFPLPPAVRAALLSGAAECWGAWTPDDPPAIMRTVPVKGPLPLEWGALVPSRWRVLEREVLTALDVALDERRLRLYVRDEDRAALHSAVTGWRPA